jgi:hypothetical protein
MLTITYVPLFVTVLFRGMPGMWKSRHRLILCWLVFMQALYPGRKTQIPPDFVVKSQPIDIMDVIRSRIRRQNVVQTLSSNRLSRYKPLSASEASWFTTKSVGV